MGGKTYGKAKVRAAAKKGWKASEVRERLRTIQ